MKCKLLFIGSVVLIIVLSGAVDTTSGDAAASTVLGSGASLLTEPALPDTTCPSGGQCFADVPSTNPFYTFINRIYQQDLVTGYPCGGFAEPCDPESRPYYRPINNVTRSQMAKFIDNARRLPEIHIETNNVGAPIYVSNTVGSAIIAQSGDETALSAHSTTDYGVWGSSTSSIGVRGTSISGYGVSGGSTSNTGVLGGSDSGAGVRGTSSSGTGVYGWTGNASGNWAGYFDGNVNVIGTCCGAGSSSFRIDDPLDPANKYLNQSSVQSPNMTTVINGNVTLDGRGETGVTVPAWFEAANRDFRYTLTAVGSPGPNLYISQELSGDHFKIAGGTAGGKVSWQVTGIRQDPFANAHRIPVEEDKPANEKGKYLHPTEWGQPESSGIDYGEQQRMQQAQQANESRP